MPALPTIVSDYLTTVKDALTTGSDLGSSVRGAAQNYLRAQDMATVLDLLQAALTQTTPLTTVSGTTTSVTDGAATFVAGTQVGNTVTFTGNVTATIAGLSRVIISNTTTTLTWADPLPDPPVIADTYTLQGTMLGASVTDLRDGKGVADATPGNPYYSNKSAVQGLLLGVQTLAGTVAERNIGRPGLTALAASTDTVVVLSDAGVDYRIDELRGMRLVVAAIGEGFVLTNNENTATLRGPMAATPSGGEAVTITVPIDDFGGTSAPKIVTHPGAQPGENAFLADLINQLQTLVVAFTLPT